MMPSKKYPEDSRELRLQAIIDHAEWLQEGASSPVHSTSPLFH